MTARDAALEIIAGTLGMLVPVDLSDAVAIRAAIDDAKELATALVEALEREGIRFEWVK